MGLDRKHRAELTCPLYGPVRLSYIASLCSPITPLRTESLDPASHQQPAVAFRDMFEIDGMAELRFYVWKITGLRFGTAGGKGNPLEDGNDL